MSRDKENKPLPKHPRSVSSVFIGKQPTPPSAEFFTDSLIDDDTSRIPTPSHARIKPSLGNPRRALGMSKSLQFPGDSKARHGASQQHTAANSIRHEPPVPVLRRPLSMRSSQSELITPPQSRDGPDALLKSPTSEASNPPQDLTDVYQRIYDEEALADTQRDSSGSEGYDSDYVRDEQSPSRRPHRDHQSATREAVTDPPGLRAAISHTRQHELNKENAKEEHTAALSEGSGISFLNQLTDQNLAAKATPVISSHVKNMKRLHHGISAGPITFNAGTKPSEFIADDARSNASSGGSSRSSRRRVLKLNSPVVNGAPKAYSDTTLDVRARASPSPLLQKNAVHPLGRSSFSQSMREPLREMDTAELEQVYVPSKRGDDDGDETSDELRHLERRYQKNQEGRLFGMETKATAVARPHFDDFNKFLAQRHEERERYRDIDEGQADDLTTTTANEHAGEESARIPHQWGPSNMPVINNGEPRKWQQLPTDQRAERAQSVASEMTSSAVDWAAVDDADMPVRSIEADEPHDDEGASYVSSPRPRLSFDQLRRHENETTGMSFQVSESPPVKQKKSSDDLAREREMGQLSRQALTKSRLEAIRERSPWEAHRRLSRSPSGSSLRKSISNDVTKQEAITGEPIPDTPIVVFRSSSSSSREAPRSDRDKQSSHEALQRFARLSTTPKSSPSIAPTVEQPGKKGPVGGTGDSVSDSSKPFRPAVAATPRVIGAWTDTVLPPDTIDTEKTSKPAPKYTQTPHVTAGGWIDTPIVPGQQPPPRIPESMDEEEAAETTTAGAAPNPNPEDPQPPIGRSALSNIIASQRARDPAATTPNDTLNLGETTIASLEDLVNLDEADVTTLIRLGAEHDALRQSFGDLSALSANYDAQPPALTEGEPRNDAAEIVVLDRLAQKLHTLQTNIRQARKAASRFEREMSEHGGGDDDDDNVNASDGDITHRSTKAAATASAPPPPSSSTTINPQGLLPMTLTPLRIPIPLLFRPVASALPTTNTSSSKRSTTTTTAAAAARLRNTTKQSRSFRRPTPLMWLLMALFFWRLGATFVHEVYGEAHPLYAESFSWPGLSDVDGAVPAGGGASKGSVGVQDMFGNVAGMLVDGCMGLVDGVEGAFGNGWWFQDAVEGQGHVQGSSEDGNSRIDDDAERYIGRQAPPVGWSMDEDEVV